MVLKGIVNLQNPGRFHMITSAVEHPAILNPALFLMELGADVTFLGVDRFGRVDPQEVRKSVKPNTGLISIMLANNETGTLQPVAAIAEIAREFEIPLHTDAAQAVGKIPVDVHALGLDFLTVAGHKLYGPKGVGALFMKKGRTLTPLIHGAAQEGGRRAGTESVILETGLGAASRTARERMQHDQARMQEMRDRLEKLLFAGIEGLVLNGHPQERLPNTLNVCVPGLAGSEILEESRGSAPPQGRPVTTDRSPFRTCFRDGCSRRDRMGALRLTVAGATTWSRSRPRRNGLSAA